MPLLGLVTYFLHHRSMLPLWSENVFSVTVMKLPGFRNEHCNLTHALVFLYWNIGTIFVNGLTVLGQERKSFSLKLGCSVSVLRCGLFRVFQCGYRLELKICFVHHCCTKLYNTIW